MAVVTGSSGGIGAGVATHLARAGAKVALVARREDKLLELKANIEDEGGVAIAIKTDVTKRNEVRFTCSCGLGSTLKQDGHASGFGANYLTFNVGVDVPSSSLEPATSPLQIRSYVCPSNWNRYIVETIL